MAYCRNCGCSVTDERPHALCQQCEASSLTVTEADDWVPIARMANLAEAGFLCELLDSRGLPARLDQLNDFSAVDGTWQTRFILKVPSDFRARATDLLRDEVATFHAEDKSDDVSAEMGASASPEMPRPQLLSIIGPLLLLAMVAMSSYAAGRAVGRPMPGPAISSDLWGALRETTQPLISVSPDGKLQRQLQFDRDEGTLILEDDRDGDGRFDRRRVFREDSVVAQP